MKRVGGRQGHVTHALSYPQAVVLETFTDQASQSWGVLQGAHVSTEHSLRQNTHIRKGKQAR